MTLCVLVGDVAVPIWWEDLAKAGHFSQKEKIAMLRRVMDNYGLKRMTLFADREYISKIGLSTLIIVSYILPFG